jgi:Tol biopolymer transport system component
MKHVNLNGDDMDAVIIGNFDVYAGEITPEFSQTGKWYDYITGDSLEVSSTDQSVTLQPGEYRVYTSEKIAPSGLSVSIDEYREQFRSSVYPNPSSDKFNIAFELADESAVQIKVYDVYGREVAQLLNGSLEAGDHEILWTPEAANPKGVYIIEITSGNNAMTKKVLYK